MTDKLNNNSASPRDAWYRQPILWLGAAILVAALAACIWTIVIAYRYPPVPIERSQETLLGVPLDSAPATAGSSEP